MHEVSVKEDFSETPGGRVYSDGPHSGEEFLDKVLRPAYRKVAEEGGPLLVDLDGTYGYSTGFLEQAFGGLAREMGPDLVDIRLNFKSTEDSFLVEEIREYIHQR